MSGATGRHGLFPKNILTFQKLMRELRLEFRALRRWSPIVSPSYAFCASVDVAIAPVCDGRVRKTPIAPCKPLKYHDSAKLLFGLIWSYLAAFGDIWCCFAMFALVLACWVLSGANPFCIAIRSGPSACRLAPAFGTETVCKIRPQFQSK